MKNGKKEKYIYGSKKIELSNTKYMANLLRNMSNYNFIMANEKNDYLWIVYLDKEHSVSSVYLIAPSYDVDLVGKEILEVFTLYDYKEFSYAIVGSYNSDETLNIKDECLEAINKILIYAEKCKVNITDYLAVSKNSWYSFYKEGDMEKLKTCIKDEIIKEKMTNKKIADKVLSNYKKRKAKENL